MPIAQSKMALRTVGAAVFSITFQLACKKTSQQTLQEKAHTSSNYISWANLVTTPPSHKGSWEMQSSFKKSFA